MKIKMTEQVIEVPNDVGETMLKDQEAINSNYVCFRQMVTSQEGWSYEVQFPLIYEKVDSAS